MPYLPGKLPYRGWITDCPYTNVPDGYSVDMLNVLPADPFRRRVRLGTRPAMNRVYDFGSGVTIQGMFRCISYNDPSSPTRKDRVFIVANGKAYYMDATSVAPVQITSINGSTSTASFMTTTARVCGVQLGRYLYLVDTGFTSTTAGGATNPSAYWKIDLLSATLAITYWHHQTGGGNQIGPEDLIRNQPNGAGTAYHYAQTICRYGGRIVLGGIKGIENVWFMSKVNEPNEWDTGVISSGDAIAGNATDTTIGPAGDEIVACLPLGDRGVLFAGKRTLAYLTNDPAVDPNAARLSVMSNTIGIVGPKAWCEGPEKSIYMLGQDGLYRLRPNDFSVDRGNLVSLNKLDSWFNQLRFDLLDVALHYDVERRGVWIFMNRTDGPANSTHLFYSEQTDGFFPVRLYDPMIPGASYTTQSATADGRNQIMLCAYGRMIGFFDQRLVGGIDGYPGSGYSVSGPSTTEEKQAQRIQARISIGPMIASQPSLVMIKEIQVELGIDDYLPSASAAGIASRPYVELHCSETAMEAIAEDVSSLLVQETSQVIDANTGSSTIDCNSGSDWYDCGYAKRAAGVYSSQDSFAALTSRLYYSEDNKYVLARQSFGISRWVLRFVDSVTLNGTTGTPVLFAQMPAVGAATSDDPEIGTYNVVENGDSSKITTDVTMTVSRNDFAGADITNLGYLREGINNRMRVRKRAGGAYLRIATVGYPFAIERVAALVDPISTRRDVVEVT